MNFKKLTSDASSVFSRAMQLTGEKFGTAEKTEFDGRLEALLQRSERTEEHTKKILAAIEGYLQPNPTARVEDFFSEKFQINKDASRLNNLESFGQVLTDASNALGPSTDYGDTLAKVSSVEFQIGAAEREMVQSAIVNTIGPLKRFLEGEMKNISKEKKALMTKRLNLDSCKSRLKKARNTEGEAAKGGQSVDQIEAELKILQCEFEKQVEIVTILLNELDKAHKNHQRCLQDFVDAQLNFFAKSHQHLTDLQRQIQFGYGGPNNVAAVNSTSNLPPGLASGPSQTLANWTDSGTRRAKVLFDYDAINGNELSIKRMDELIVYKLPGLDAEFVMAERGNQRGRVPISYLEIIP